MLRSPGASRAQKRIMTPLPHRPAGRLNKPLSAPHSYIDSFFLNHRSYAKANTIPHRTGPMRLRPLNSAGFWDVECQQSQCSAHGEYQSSILTQVSRLCKCPSCTTRGCRVKRPSDSLLRLDPIWGFFASARSCSRT